MKTIYKLFVSFLLCISLTGCKKETVPAKLSGKIPQIVDYGYTVFHNSENNTSSISLAVTFENPNDSVSFAGVETGVNIQSASYNAGMTHQLPSLMPHETVTIAYEATDIEGDIGDLSSLDIHLNLKQSGYGIKVTDGTFINIQDVIEDDAFVAVPKTSIFDDVSIKESAEISEEGEYSVLRNTIVNHTDQTISESVVFITYTVDGVLKGGKQELFWDLNPKEERDFEILLSTIPDHADVTVTAYRLK